MSQVNSMLKNKRMHVVVPLKYQFGTNLNSMRFVPFLSRYLTCSGRKSLTKIDELVISCNFMVNHRPFRQLFWEIDSFGPVFRGKKQSRLRSHLANMDLGGFWPINPHSFRESTFFLIFLTFSHLKEAPVLISSLGQFFGILLLG